MFNVAILNVKDVLRYLVSVVVVVLMITCTTRYFVNMKKNMQMQDVSQMARNSLSTVCIDDTIPGIENINAEELTTETKDEESKKSIWEKILNVELGIFELNSDESDTQTVENSQEEIIVSEVTEENNTEETEEVPTDVSTEVVTENPISDKYTNLFSKVKIKNETSYELTEDLFTSKLELNNKNIIIFHTHTSESYTPSETYNYVQTGNYRTTDKNYSVVRVGDELQKYLSEYGYSVIHDTTYHDYPAYTGSYNRSLETVSNLLNTQEADIIIDLHRDAIGSNSSYAPTVKIGDEYAAQLMFVIGTDGGGLWHPNWKENLKFAITVQEKAEEMYPGLFKTMIVRNSRYNQHLGKAACIIEVGATGNTLEQCLTSTKYLSKVLDEVLK